MIAPQFYLIMNTESRNNPYDIPALILSSVLIVFFLFFIDEGYYDFRWMKDPGNWIAFILYFVPVFGLQLFSLKVILRKYTGPGKLLVSIIAGAVIGITLTVVTILLLMN